MLEVLILHVIVKVVIEAGIIDSVHVDVTVGSGMQFLKKGVMSLGVCSVGRV